MADKETMTKVEASEASQEESSEVLSEEAVDAIIAEEDPEFANSLGQIQIDATSAPAEILSDIVEIEYTFVMEKKKWLESTAFRKRLALLFPFFPWMSFKYKEQSNLLRLNLKRRKEKTLYFFKNIGPLSVQFLKTSMADFKSGLQNFFVSFKEFSLLKKLLFVALIVATGASGYLLYRLYSHGLIHEHQELFVASLGEWAQEKHTFSPEEPMESFYESTRTSQNIILMPKMVVNLRRSPESGAVPMAAFEFLVEGAASEVVVEIKDREPEVRDLFMRIMEEMTFEQLSSGEGKRLLCDRLKKEINTILTQGFVRRVFIKTAIVKP